MGEIGTSSSSSAAEGPLAGSTASKRKEIFTYKAPWTIYTSCWRRNPAGRFQIAVGSFIEEYINQIHIVQLDRSANDGEGQFTKITKFDHPYPATKMAFAPASRTSSGNSDLIATSGDYLRLWEFNGTEVTMKGLLNNNKHTGKMDADFSKFMLSQ